MLYKVSNKSVVLKEISKLKPINYNQFRWWRRFDKPNKPLPPSSPFLQRIKNGDFDFSQYYWQWKYCELELNDFILSYNGDRQKLLENNAVDLSRRKKLIEDFEKDEANKLQELEKNFLKEFYMSSDDYYSHIEKCGGTLEDFYMYCLKTFDKKKTERRGRPKKYK